MAKIILRNSEGIFIIQGILTYAVLEKEWKDILKHFFEVKDQALVLDLENVKKIDSSFLAFLLALLRAVHHEKRTLKILHLTPDIQALMEVQGLWPLFEKLTGTV